MAVSQLLPKQLGQIAETLLARLYDWMCKRTLRSGNYIGSAHHRYVYLLACVELVSHVVSDGPGHVSSPLCA